MRKLHKKYQKPKRLFDLYRIREESRLKNKYGLKNMRELWIARAFLRNARAQARKLLALPPEIRAAKEKILIDKLVKYNILAENSKIDDILSLKVESILERRLQTIVYRKGFAKSIKHARQLIVHGYIAVGNNRVTSPSALIDREKEKMINWYKPYNPGTQESKQEVKNNG
ncbi:MAG: 30S ribosomal protein S4 [Candidatus Anstonellales archaeon]